MTVSAFVKAEHNHDYSVELYDFTRILDYLNANKPPERKGQKYALWTRQRAAYSEHYENTPYWINVIRYGDDDLITTRCFSDRAEAERMLEELVTCPQVPDFKALGFE